MLTHTQICEAVAEAYNVPYTVQVADDIRCVITQIGGETLVAAPGTTDAAGWRDDFEILPTWFPTIGLYHSGFGSKGSALFGAVAPKLPIIGRIVCAGHSLGAQLAQVMAALYAAQRPKNARCIVFGCPRGPSVINWQAPRLVRKSLEAVEYRNAGDPICDVPPWFWRHNARAVSLGDPIHNLAPSRANHDINLYVKNMRAAGSVS